MKSSLKTLTQLSVLLGVLASSPAAWASGELPACSIEAYHLNPLNMNYTVMIDGTAVENHPNLRTAAAAVAQKIREGKCEVASCGTRHIVSRAGIHLAVQVSGEDVYRTSSIQSANHTLAMLQKMGACPKVGAAE